MDPTRIATARGSRRLPRTRGDGPRAVQEAPPRLPASPHTRGWTRGEGGDDALDLGFPAHAGMDPGLLVARGVLGGLPRTRGDGPRRRHGAHRARPASPHTRGWTRSVLPAAAMRPGFPAHAGMDRGRGRPPTDRRRLPRTRGDGPQEIEHALRALRASPHTRGWTRRPLARQGPRRGFPAHAGMDRGRGRPPTDRRRLPRTRGDGPQEIEHALRALRASPHTRGWTRRPLARQGPRRGFPAHAGMDRGRGRPPTDRRRLPRTRGDGPQEIEHAPGALRASPHTRGWTRGDHAPGPLGTGFPAHAGMDPLGAGPRPFRRRLPRTRGDGPRARAADVAGSAASPHTRGWTVTDTGLASLAHGFPAHAGMDPPPTTTSTPTTRLPRTRGDGPLLEGPHVARLEASPHTRGWTPHLPRRQPGRDGFPAHAGMDPAQSSRRCARRGLPRTRGDGPAVLAFICRAVPASPHTRGWTAEGRGRGPEPGGFPAHAGMDPRYAGAGL